MRISTNQIYQNGLSGILRQQARVAKLQEQLSDDFVRVRTAADDPVAFAQIEFMSQRLSTTEFLQKNRENADGMLSMEEALLGECTNTLQRLRDLQVKAGNSALSEDDRKALAVEATVLLNELVGYANSKDINGDYMFSGAQTATLPFSMNTAGQYVYNGDSTQRLQFVMSELQMAINDPGDALFMLIPSGNGSFAISQTATPNMGTASISSGFVVDSAAYIPDDYTVNFVLNSQGNLVLMVNGVTGGNIIPPSGLPDDAPLYQDGMTVSFNGIEIQISGTPEPGDAFSITPSQNESVFATVQSMINNLNQPYSTASEKAAVTTVNSQILEQLDSALDAISDIRTSLGARLSRLVQAEATNNDIIEISKTILNRLQKIDPLALASDYEQEMLNLQAAEQSFVQIQGLSVFNYI